MTPLLFCVGENCSGSLALVIFVCSALARSEEEGVKLSFISLFCQVRNFVSKNREGESQAQGPAEDSAPNRPKTVSEVLVLWAPPPESRGACI